jgi:regulator of protease activity HflC (stomatin/prohibitin superfamily)
MELLVRYSLRFTRCLKKLKLNYHISPSQANIIYQQLGADYADRIIAPTIQESVKASVAKFNAEDLITKRATAKAVIDQMCCPKLQHY